MKFIENQCEHLSKLTLYHLKKRATRRCRRAREPRRIPLLFLRGLAPVKFTKWFLLISEDYKGEGELILEGGGGLKEGLQYLHLMFILWMCFHYVISVWDKGTHLVTVACLRNKLESNACYYVISKYYTQDCPVQKQTPDSRLSSWQAIISVQKETIFSTLVHLNNTSHWSIITQKEKSINFIPMK